MKEESKHEIWNRACCFMRQEIAKNLDMIDQEIIALAVSNFPLPPYNTDKLQIN